MADWKLRLKHLLKRMTGRYNHLKVQTKCKKVWYGNEYGGFYVNPDLLKANTVVYSFGIGEDASFDRTMINRHKSHVFAFDPTPKSIAWVAENAPKNNFHFYDYGLGRTTGTAVFHLPKNPDYVSGSVLLQKNVSDTRRVKVQMKSFGDIIQELKHTKIDVLKMDIEGSEYEVLEGILEAPVEITQFLVEFHERFFEKGNEKTGQFIQKMNAQGYMIFAVSTSFEEISFVKQSALSYY